MRRHHHPVLGVLIISLGIILLLNTLNILPWVIWSYLKQFWPLVLILIGFQIIFGEGNLGNFLTTLIAVTLVVFLILTSIASVNPDMGMMINQNLNWQYIRGMR